MILFRDEAIFASKNSKSGVGAKPFKWLAALMLSG